MSQKIISKREFLKTSAISITALGCGFCNLKSFSIPILESSFSPLPSHLLV